MTDISASYLEKSIRAVIQQYINSKKVAHGEFCGEGLCFDITCGWCRAVAFVVQEYFGGNVYEARFSYTKASRYGCHWNNHVWNIVDGSILDMTKKQFPPLFPYQELVTNGFGSRPQEITREEYLSNPLRRRAYNQLFHNVVLSVEKK